MNIQITLRYDQSDLVVEFSDDLIDCNDEQEGWNTRRVHRRPKLGN
jgi:hypothetical protein